MGLARTMLWLGYALLGCAGLFLICAIFGLLLLEPSPALGMAIIGLVTGLFGIVFMTAGFQSQGQETTSEGIIFLVVFWLVIPIIGSTPFMILTDLSLVGALFEGISAMTTTGASRIVPETAPDTLLLWRSMLQFAGGVSVAVFAVVILAALNLSGIGIHRSALFTYRTGELFPRLVGIGRIIAVLYLALALGAFVLMLLGGTDPFEGLTLALSGISTGGLKPFSGTLSEHISGFSAAILALLCLFGAMNVSVLYDISRQRQGRIFQRLFTQVEHRALFGLIGGLVIVGVGFAGIANLFPVVLDSLFFISSAGYRYEVISLDMIPSPALITLALIGGSALSTAGGIKIIRLLLLFRNLDTDMARMSHPSRVVPIQFRSRVIDDDAFLSVWMYFFGYALCFGLGAMAFGAAGLNLQDSLATSAASLSNMGPLLPMTLPESGLTYAEFTPAQMIVASVLMLVGRVEVIIALSLFMPTVWRG